ncbi:DExD-box helicase 21 [Phyllostomus discolor]|uniref:DExD-box helicase 21 n=1 Tax=Phyllostomus discolor TaxID=89673 RepID=A0A834EBG8_9CHIR|nr:DExD-box helicase 21 [Phyllostomus discolor]
MRRKVEKRSQNLIRLKRQQKKWKKLFPQKLKKLKRKQDSLRLT